MYHACRNEDHDDSTTSATAGPYGDASTSPGPGRSDVVYPSIGRPGYSRRRSSNDSFDEENWIDEDDALGGQLSGHRMSLAERWESVDNDTYYGHSDEGITMHHVTVSSHEHRRDENPAPGGRSDPRLARYIRSLIVPNSWSGDNEIAANAQAVQNTIRSGSWTPGSPSSTYAEPGSTPPDLTRTNIEVEYEPEDEDRMSHIGSGIPNVSVNPLPAETLSNLLQRGFVTPTQERPESFGIDSNETSWADSAFSSDDVDVDMTAILDPPSYEDELDDLESLVFENCDVAGLLSEEYPTGVVAVVPTLHGSIARVSTGLISAMDCLHERGFCKDNIVILVQDFSRVDVVQAMDIPINSIRELCSLALSSLPDAPHLDVLIKRFCSTFGLSTELLHDRKLQDQFLDLLCSLLRLAVVLYARSHCSGLPWEKGRTVEQITYQGPKGDKHVLRCRRLACLRDFVGATVWTFDVAPNDDPATVSMSARQLADLWGPVHIVPSAKGTKFPLAIQTEGGLLFRSSRQKLAEKQVGPEIPCHWVRARPAWSGPDALDSNSVIPGIVFKTKEEVPDVLEDFDLSQRLLIGHPVPSSATATTVLSSPSVTIEIGRNPLCSVDLEEFGVRNEFNIHPVGTSEDYFAPDEYNLSLSAGQYLDVGLSKIWKRRPGVTHKDRILSFLVGSAAKPERVKDVLRLHIGLEMSACTFNARRISLEQALKIAFPRDAQEIDRACNSGNALILAGYLGELGTTGLGRTGRALLYLPLSKGIGAVFELHKAPKWMRLLRDTKDSSCFATLSPHCLQFSFGQDGNNIGRMCSRVASQQSALTLHTSIQMNPKTDPCLPLKIGTRIELDSGHLIVDRGHENNYAVSCRPTSAMRVFKTGNNTMHRHRELQDPSRAGRHTFAVFILDRWPS